MAKAADKPPTKRLLDRPLREHPAPVVGGARRLQGRRVPRYPRSSPIALAKLFGAIVEQRLRDCGASGQRRAQSVEGTSALAAYNDARLLQAQQAGFLVHAIRVFRASSNLPHRNEVGNRCSSFHDQHGFTRLYPTKKGAQTILHFGDGCPDHLRAPFPKDGHLSPIEVGHTGAIRRHFSSPQALWTGRVGGRRHAADGAPSVCVCSIAADAAPCPFLGARAMLRQPA